MKKTEANNKTKKQWIAIVVEALPDGIYAWGPFDKEDQAHEFAEIANEKIQGHRGVLWWDEVPLMDPSTFRDPDFKAARWLPNNRPGERFADPARWGPEGKIEKAEKKKGK